MWSDFSPGGWKQLWLFFVCFFQIKYRQDFNKMKGAAHYHSLPAQDNLVLKRAQSVNKLVSEVRRGTAPSVYCHLLWFRQTVKGWPQNDKFCVNATWTTHALPVAKERIGRQKQFITEPRTKLIKSSSDGSEVSSWNSHRVVDIPKVSGVDF